MHLSEAQFSCPGLELLVSALVLHGSGYSPREEGEGCWGGGSFPRGSLGEGESESASDRWTQREEATPFQQSWEVWPGEDNGIRHYDLSC